jgi:hypothetical protein
VLITCKWSLFIKQDTVIVIYIKNLFFPPVPAIAPPIEAHNAAHGTAPTGQATDPIAPPTNEPTVQPKLQLSDAVPLPPDAISVNTKHSYVGYKILKVISMKVIVL